MTAYEELARREKARKLCALLHAHGFDSASVGRMDDTQWRMVAISADVHMPSAETRTEVLRQLRDLE